MLHLRSAQIPWLDLVSKSETNVSKLLVGHPLLEPQLTLLIPYLQAHVCAKEKHAWLLWITYWHNSPSENWPILSATRTHGTCSHKWRCFFTLALIPVSRGVCTPKKWMSIFTFIDGFPPSKLIVFCRSPPGICAVSTKKNEMTRFTMRNRFPLFKGQASLIGQSDPFFFWLLSTNRTLLHSYVPLIEHSDFILGILTLPSALSRLFWQPTLGVFSQFISLCIQLQCGSQICIPQQFTAKTSV